MRALPYSFSRLRQGCSESVFSLYRPFPLSSGISTRAGEYIINRTLIQLFISQKENCNIVIYLILMMIFLPEYQKRSHMNIIKYLKKRKKKTIDRLLCDFWICVSNKKYHTQCFVFKFFGI